MKSSHFKEMETTLTTMIMTQVFPDPQIVHFNHQFSTLIPKTVKPAFFMSINKRSYDPHLKTPRRILDHGINDVTMPPPFTKTYQDNDGTYVLSA